jgi:hypothetical protein
VTVRTVDLTVTVRGLVGAVVIVLGVGGRGLVERMGAVVIRLDVGRTLDPAPRKSYVHLHSPDAGPAHSANVDFDLRNPQARGETPEPALGRAGSKQGAQEHVPADSRGGVEDGKPTL